MKVLVNFSHPIVPDELARLEEMVGDKVVQVMVPIQLDLDGDVRAQVNEIMKQAAAKVAVETGDRRVDMVVPASLGLAAAMISARMVTPDGQHVRYVVIGRDSNSISPKFIVKDVTRGVTVTI